MAVDCSPRTAFEYLADARNLPAWCYAVKTCEQIARSGPVPGAEYAITRARAAIWLPATCELTLQALDGPRALRWLRTEGTLACEVTCEVVRLAHGAAVRYAELLQCSSDALGRVGLGVRRYQLARDLWRLRAILGRDEARRG